jgi:hypothetical protein
MSEVRPIRVHALSNADSLGYLGQQAVARAAGEKADYRIVGGHMVRLLLQVYPTSDAVPRSTLDADAAVDDVDVVGAIDKSLLAQDFTKEGGNAYLKELDEERRIEVNLLLSGSGPRPGLGSREVPGVGHVDTLPELSFIMACPPLLLGIRATLHDGRILDYTTRIPDLEAALVLKAHSWRGRQAEKDVADLYSLLAIREAHPEVDWRMDEADLRGYRRDAARALHRLMGNLTRRTSNITAPRGLDRFRMAALISKHVSKP